jgi:hypothetical protein
MLQVNQQVICRTDRVLYCLIKNQEASKSMLIERSCQICTLIEPAKQPDLHLDRACEAALLDA